MTVDLTKLAFYSRVNYMKRDPALTSSTLVTLPAIAGTVTHTVTHNLGYIPFVQIGADTDNDGVVWTNHKVNQYTGTSLSGTESLWPDPELFYWVTTTALSIGYINHTGESGTRRIYWAIYLDYGNQ